jgi:hypothetical protein
MAAFFLSHNVYDHDLLGWDWNGSIGSAHLEGGSSFTSYYMMKARLNYPSLIHSCQLNVTHDSMILLVLLMATGQRIHNLQLELQLVNF